MRPAYSLRTPGPGTGDSRYTQKRSRFFLALAGPSRSDPRGFFHEFVFHRCSWSPNRSSSCVRSKPIAKPKYALLEGAQGDSHAYGVECSGCRTPISLEHGDFEFDICAIHGGLVRYCDSCGMATVWKQSIGIPSFRPHTISAAPKL
jgi:hypothetical protein